MKALVLSVVTVKQMRPTTHLCIAYATGRMFCAPQVMGIHILLLMTEAVILE